MGKSVKKMTSNEHNTIWIVALEPIDQRYTAQWYTAIPNEINQAIEENGLNYSVVTVSGDSIGESRTAGAFLDFALTNVWKNTQINKIAQMFSDGTIKPGDKFLVTDAWHSGIIQIRYMSDLLDIPVDIHAIWHAGSYDKTDILGMKIRNLKWSRTFEGSIYHACDYNYFGSVYHLNMFCRVLDVSSSKAYHSGQPHTKILENCASIPWEQKEDIVLFGHRISPDKNPHIFEDLAQSLPEYKFVFSQKLNLSKEEYYDLIRKSKLSFSANNHENFGISMVEAVFNGTSVMVPDKLSYGEMYFEEYKYDPTWIDEYDRGGKEKMIEMIHRFMKSPSESLQKQQEFLLNNYMKSTTMVSRLLEI